MKGIVNKLNEKIIKKPILKLFCVFLFISFAFLNIQAQNIQVKAYLDTTTILIGDQIHINLFVDQPQGAKIIFPVLNDSIAGKIEVLTKAKIDTMFVGNGRLRLLQRNTITCFDSGVYQVPPLKFAFNLGAINDTITTVPLVLRVNTIPIKDAKKIFDIKGIINIPFTFAEILPYILVSLGALLIIALAVYIYIRLKQNKPIFLFQKPAEPAYVIAFRELKKLKSEKLWQKGQIKQYYTGLTDIIRTYIEGRFKILAMESTSDEIIAEIKNIEAIDKKSIVELMQLLETADLVKFAKAEPLPDENDNLWQVAYNFVLNTYKEPETLIEQNNLQNTGYEASEKDNSDISSFGTELKNIN